MSAKLGNKTYKSQNSLGQKASSFVNSLGAKTHNILRKLPDVKARAIALNNNAINYGNDIIRKSGAVTNTLRKSTGIINSVTQGLSDVIGSDVPLVGSALKIGARATKLIHQGANRIDEARDLANAKLQKYDQATRQTNNIEKMNPRKVMAENENNDPSNNFV